MKVLAKDIMETSVRTVSADLPLPDLERRFVADGVLGFPVVDSDETIRGVVTVSDVLARVCKERGIVEMSTAFYEEDPHVECGSVSSDWVSAEVGKRSDHLLVGDIMSDHIISVTPDSLIREIAMLIIENRIHRVLVVEAKRLVGLVSSIDIVRACGSSKIDISFKAPTILDF